MPFQPAPACANAVFRFTESGSGRFIGIYSLNFMKLNEVPFTFAEVSALVGNLNGFWEEELYPITSNEAMLSSIRARGLSFEEDVQYELPIDTAGQQAGDRLPSSVSLVTTFRTGLTGRSAIGRVYQIGMNESQTAGDFVTPAFAGAVLDAWQALPLSITDANVKHCVLSRFADGVQRTEARPLEVLTYTQSDSRVDSQRRRLPKSND